MAPEKVMFAFRSCVGWLREKAAQLKGTGYVVDLLDNEEQLPSAVLRVSGDSVEAELVVWEGGSTSAMVYNLARDGYDLDRHDLVLTERFSDELGPFFDLLSL
jgi:hypothetical protein